MHTNKKISRAPVLVIFILLVLIISSCSNIYLDNENTAPTLNIPETPAPVSDRRDPENASGNIVMGVYGFDTLDPLRTQNESIRKYMTLVYESLVNLGKDAMPEPQLALAWNTEDGGITWHFTIRDDAYYHDGSQLTAYDVKNTAEWILQNGGAYEACVSGISKINVTSRHALDIVSSYPDAFLPSKMIFPIVKSEDAGNFTTPNGTGQYKYGGNDGNSQRFSLNAEYYGEIPMLASFEIRSYESAEALYSSGADMMFFFDDNVVRFSALENYMYCAYSDRVLTCLLPSQRTDISLRQYINSVLDRRMLMNAVIAGKGTVKLLPIPEGTYYRTHGDDFPGNINGTKPESISLIVNSRDRDLVRLSYVIKNALSSLETECTVTEYPNEEYGAAVTSGDYDFALMNLQMSAWPDLYDLFAADGALNYNGYSDESMNSLLLSLRNAYEDSAINGAFSRYAQAQLDKISARAAETLPVIGLYEKNASVLIKKTIGGAQQHNFTFWNTMDQFGSWYIKQQDTAAEG